MLDEVLSVYAAQIKQMNLHLPSVLNITRPASPLSTQENQYFVMGTSDPNAPLYLDGELVENRGELGSFGVLLTLSGEDESRFLFTQSDIKKEVIFSHLPTTSNTSVINNIVQDSMFPLVQGGTRVGKTLPASCIAPAGSTVLASLGTETIKLVQANDASRNTPVLFSAPLPISGNFPADETTKVGPISYTLIQGGTTLEFESTGDVYIAGKETNIVVQVSKYLGFLYPSLDNLSVHKEVVKEGAVDYLMSQGNRYFSVYSGGFIPADRVKILEGKDPVSNTLTEVKASPKNKGEIFEFFGSSSPFYDVRVTDDSVEIELQNTTADELSLPTLPTESMFSSVERSEGKRSILFTFTFKKTGSFWGYNVYFDQGITVLEIQHRPILSTTPFLPLDGITVTLDPGHGGEDPGALGFAGEEFSKESDLNLATALVLKNKLESLGAEVALTRDTDARYSLDARAEIHERSQADFFLSLHHNSVAETSDGNSAKGMEVYYYTSFSAPLANSILDSLGKNVARPVRSVIQSTYTVTLLPYSPSALLELGFMCNATEFEQALEYSTMKSIADSIADSILATLAQ